MRWAILLLVACSSPRPPPVPDAGTWDAYDDCGADVVTLIAHLSHDHAQGAALFDDYDDLATRERCVRPGATLDELRAWQSMQPYLRDRDGVLASTVLPLSDDVVVFEWRAVEDSIAGGGGRATVMRGRQILGHVDVGEASTMSNVSARPDQGWFLLGETYDGNGWPPSRAIVVALGAQGLDVLTTEDVATIDPAPGGALIRRRGQALNEYPDPPVFAYRWQIDRTGGGLALRETPLTPWLDAVEAYCMTHPCGHRVDAVERHRGVAKVWIEDENDPQTVVVRAGSRGWRVAAR